jgi:hypothetical protein
MAIRHTTVTLDPRKDEHPSREPLPPTVVLAAEETPAEG